MAVLGSKADEDNRRDYAAKEKFDEAIRSLGALLGDADCKRRMNSDTQARVAEVQHRLKERSDHIVAVWD